MQQYPMDGPCLVCTTCWLLSFLHTESVSVTLTHALTKCRFLHSLDSLVLHWRFYTKIRKDQITMYTHYHLYSFACYIFIHHGRILQLNRIIIQLTSNIAYIVCTWRWERYLKPNRVIHESRWAAWVECNVTISYLWL